MLRPLALAVLFALTGATAQASCAAAPFAGSWVNETPGTAVVARLTVKADCAAAAVELWAPCAPADCTWGRLDGTPMQSGWLYSHADNGIAQRHIFIRPDSANRLRVYVKTDFTDPARPDTDSDEYFSKL